MRLYVISPFFIDLYTIGLYNYLILDINVHFKRFTYRSKQMKNKEKEPMILFAPSYELAMEAMKHEARLLVSE